MCKHEVKLWIPKSFDKSCLVGHGAKESGHKRHSLWGKCPAFYNIQILLRSAKFTIHKSEAFICSHGLFVAWLFPHHLRVPLPDHSPLQVSSQLASCPSNLLLSPDERFGNSKCCRVPFLLNQAPAWRPQNQRLPNPSLTIPGAGGAPRSKNTPDTFSIVGSAPLGCPRLRPPQLAPPERGRGIMLSGRGTIGSHRVITNFKQR